MQKLNTSFLGLQLKNPLIASSFPLTGSVAEARQLEEAGVSAIVMNSIFEEQIRNEIGGIYESLANDDSGVALDYLRADLPMHIGTERYIDTLRALSAALKIPVIASINCAIADQWVTFARKLEEAGAAALELNIYDIPQDNVTDSAAIEARHLELVKAIKAEVKIPVAIKLSPYYASLLHFARELDGLGAGGLVLFNRFLQPDIDIEEMRLLFKANFSQPADIHLPLRWVALLRERVGCDLALSGGVHDTAGAIKALLAGANVVYLCSVLYQKPIGSAVPHILRGIANWMERHEFNSLQAVGKRLQKLRESDSHGFERAHYARTAPICGE